MPSSSARRGSTPLSSAAALCASQATTSRPASSQSPASRMRNPAPVRSTASALAWRTSTVPRMAASMASTICPSPPRSVRNSGGGVLVRACARRPGSFRQHAARQAAVLVGQFHEPRQHARDAQFAGVPAVDAGEQRLRQVVHRFASVMLFDELGHRLVGRARPGCAQQLQAPCGVSCPGRPAACPAAAVSAWAPSSSGRRAAATRRPPLRTYVTRRWSLEPITWSASPRSRSNSSAAGLADRKLSGPASMVQPSTRSVWMTPPSRGRDSTMVEATPPLAR